MVSFEVTRHNDEVQEIVQYNVFSFISWPFEIIALGYRFFAEWVEFSATGFCVVLIHEWVRERFIPAGSVGEPSLHRTLRTAKLFPFRTVTRYEEKTDYQQAVKEGIGKTMLFCGRASPRSKNNR